MMPTTILSVYQDAYAIGRQILSAAWDRTITRKRGSDSLVNERNASIKSVRIGSGSLQRGCDGAKEDVSFGTGDTVEVSVLRLASCCSVGWRLSVFGVDIAWKFASATE